MDLSGKKTLLNDAIVNNWEAALEPRQKRLQPMQTFMTPPTHSNAAADDDREALDDLSDSDIEDDGPRTHSGRTSSAGKVRKKGRNQRRQQMLHRPGLGN